MEPAVVVQQIPLSGVEGKAVLVTADRRLQALEIGPGERAPTREAILAQPDADTAVVLRCEDLGEVTVSPAEVDAAGTGEHFGCGRSLCPEIRIHCLAIGQETLSSRFRLRDADQEHQSRRERHAGAFRVSGQFAAAEAGESGTVSLAAGVANRRQPVVITVPVWREGHQARDEAENGLPGGQTRESHEPHFGKLPRDLVIGVRRSEINMACI